MGQNKKKSPKVEKPPRPPNTRQKAKEEARKQIAEIQKQELEDQPYGPYGILGRTIPDDDPLEDQVKSLRERVHDLEVYIRNSMRNTEFLKGDFFQWQVVYSKHFPEEMHRVFRQSWNWSQCYAGDDVTCLSKKQKREVIASLDGYIAQDDFDSIHRRLHPSQQDRFMKLLTEAFLNKHILEAFFTNPFWYVDETAQPEDHHEDTTWEGTTPLGERMNTLYSRLQKVDEGYSEVWRTVTARLCNSVWPEQGKDLAFGNAMQARRNAQCTALASKLLANKTLLCLLKPTDKEELRLSALALTLQNAAQAAVDMSVQIPILGFHTLKDLDDRFSGTSDTVKADPWSFAYNEQDECRLLGHRVLGIKHPYVFRTLNDPEEQEIEPVLRAVLLVEEEKSAVDGKSSKGESSKKSSG
ncbi:hypothetical protein BJX61DRAFT_546738 [Aspergillus egyptiacus]|nr:hypothetical protein BJX61DRAFT_546738 [Aspergillus egyptiacus]